jgi:SIR2-like domain
MSEHDRDAAQAGPSTQQAEWSTALEGEDDAPLTELVEREPPGVALFMLMTYINGVYRAIQPIPLLAEGKEFTGFERYLKPVVRRRIDQVLPMIQELRQRLGGRQRDFDLGLLRWVRRSSCLAVVIGAGVTMEAGGPSWPELVRLLLERALDQGHEIRRMVPAPGSADPFSVGPDGRLRLAVPEAGERVEFKMVSEVERVERFSPEAERNARSLLQQIVAGRADTDALMQAAQLCLDLMGQDLFQQVSMAIYARAPRPGEIYRAIAELADKQQVPGRSGIQPGWDAIISYNFDNLMGEALAERDIPYIAWAMTKRGRLGDGPREPVQREGWCQPIYHLHGYTPVRPFLITDTEFIFAASQYLSGYSDPSREIVRIVLDEYLANPVHLSLYVGCSFTDAAMNDLLRQAAQRYPGRYHYAVLKWPHRGDVDQADPATIADASEQYLQFGVQPIWVNDHSEIPALIRQLR